MPYATQEDIENLYGTDLLVRVADYDRDGNADPAVIARALASADEVCDAYLSAQYTVPLVPAPGVVKTCAIDIAVYKMALGRSGRTDEMRVRYEDALSLLEKISTGKVGLGLPPATTTNPDGSTTVTDPNVKRSGKAFDTGRA
jgi:phage gp36-like protein